MPGGSVRTVAFNRESVRSHPFFRDPRINFRAQGALDAARRYAEDLERGRLRVAEAERERRRVRAATETLLERADGLARKAEEEAAQVFSFSTSWEDL